MHGPVCEQVCAGERTCVTSLCILVCMELCYSLTGYVAQSMHSFIVYVMNIQFKLINISCCIIYLGWMYMFVI